MAIIVQKYGGSSVGDMEKLRRVAAQVVATREAGHDVVVVVSAMGNTTDELLAVAREVNPAPNRRELDMLLSVGERISMALLSMGIQALGHEAISFTGSQCGIITNDSHANARIIEVRPFRIQDELARQRIVIVAGYQGTSYTREVTTLGRGGSDMTAVALAGALGAERCEIYSDVDGVYTSDPRVVLDAERLDSITADELLELARHGAHVLHDGAVSYAKRHGIALYARSAHDPQGRGTVVRPDGWPDDALTRSACTPRGVAALTRVVVVRVPRAQSASLWRQLEQHDLSNSVLSARVEEANIEVVLDPLNVPDVEGLLRQLQVDLGESAQVRGDLTNVTLVGHDIGRRAEWSARALACLEQAHVVVTALSTSQHAVSMLVPRASREAAMRACHQLVSGAS